MVHTFESLSEKIKECEACPLHEHTGNKVTFEGHKQAKILIVGEAPAKTEVAEGRPFVGESGKFLEECLGKAGIQRSQCFVTNTVKCWPVSPDTNTTFTPTDETVATCAYNFLEEEIYLVDPVIILALGNTAFHFFFPGKGGIVAEVDSGQILITDIKDRNYPVIPLYHPRYVREKQSTELMAKFLGGLRRAVAYVENVDANGREACLEELEELKAKKPEVTAQTLSAEANTQALKESLSFVAGKKFPLPFLEVGETMKEVEFPKDIAGYPDAELINLMGTYTQIINYVSFECSKLSVEKTAKQNKYGWKKACKHQLVRNATPKPSIDDVKMQLDSDNELAGMKRDFEFSQAKYTLTEGLLQSYSRYYQVLSRELSRRGYENGRM